MKISVYKSEARGKISVPSSKSLTVRALMCAALAKGTSEIVNPLASEDTDAAAAVLGRVGATVKKGYEFWRVFGGNLQASIEDLFCGESATTLRFMTAICALIPGRHRLLGGPSLSQRPIGPLVEALKKLGVNAATEGKGMPPVVVEGGALKGEATDLPGNISSQFVSALLLIAPFAQKEMTIRLTAPLASKPYVEMTILCLKQFGINVDAYREKFVVRRQIYRPTRLEIEGDWSSASYFLALGAVAGAIEVANLKADSFQGDRVVLDFLRSMGAPVKTEGDLVAVSRGKLRAIYTDLSDCIDLLPTMSVLAALAEGKSEFTGISRARTKESDRVTAVKNNLQTLGVSVEESADRLAITGPVKVDKPVVIDSYGDHRIAMAFGVLGAAVGGVTITGAECVAKTFPTFWDMMRRVGVRMETYAK